MPQPLLCLVGPTGSGKTAVATELCDLLGGEIISADSVQIYRGLDIGSAKPTADEQRRACHHLIDIRAPHEIYSAALWAHDARAAIAEVSSRGKTPVIVGGTGFYLRALLQPETISAAPPDEKLREELSREYSQHGADYVFEKLRALDASAAARLHMNDRHRVMRAIEVALQAPQNEESAPRVLATESEFAPQVFGLEWHRETLYARLETRIEMMLSQGFIEELRGLLESGLSSETPSLQSVGYKQMQPALRDATLFARCVELWKRDTRRYAKRQMTWFRHQLPTRWIAMNASRDSAKIAAEIAREYSQCLDKSCSAFCDNFIEATRP